MKRYIIIRFSQEYDNALEDYDNLYSLHTGTTNDIMVSSNKYANIKESIDTAVAAFIKRLIDEFGYARYIGVNNIQYGELCTNKNRNIEKDSVRSINAIDYIIEYKDISEINIDSYDKSNKNENVLCQPFQPQ